MSVDSSASPRRPAILIVDDDASLCTDLSILLEAKGWTTEVAADGPAAIAAVERTRFDLAILDIGLRHIDGVHIARFMRKRWPQVRIAIHSGTDEADIRPRFSDYDAFLLKPQTIDSLMATVQGLVGRSGGEPARPAPP